MKTVMYGIAVAATVAGCGAAPAFAQTAGEPRLSLNLGAGVVLAQDPRFDGADLQLLIGTDVRLSPVWDLRIEAAGRTPATRRDAWYTTFFFTSPGAPVNQRPTVPVDFATETTRRTIADVSLLGRRYFEPPPVEGRLWQPRAGVMLGGGSHSTPGEGAVRDLSGSSRRSAQPA